MTTTTAVRRPAPGAVRRVLDIARVQTFHRTLLSGASLVPIVPALLLLVALPAVLGDAFAPNLRDGLLLGLCGAFTVVLVFPMIGTFPLVLGLGATRRAFYVATVSVAAAQAVVFATVVTLLVQAERATGGWGLSTEVVTVGPLRGLSAPEQWAFLAALFLALATGCMLLGLVQMRWGLRGIQVLAAISMAVTFVVSLVFVIALGIVLDRFGRPAAEVLAPIWSSPLLPSGSLLVLAVVFGLTGFAVLRRATS